ncbi:16S rRNA (cytosine(1402)-N(4))-methyltransferase RsmH [Candidatus Parcubacteria bacterium]|nr:MAG: 16S rRNA (cytosine(1402)-N(4))-methyltransferase RsmH [Candidatus Parcubacteria bacterium]
MEQKIHTPVLLKEVIEYLDVKKNKNYIDATVDGGSVAEAILEGNGPNGKLLGIDWDEKLVKEAVGRLEKFSERVDIVHSNFVNIASITKEKNFSNISGIVFDLGVSNFHFEKSGRGFSFLKEEPLDMRYSPNEQFTMAADILNSYSEEDLARIIKNYGEERHFRLISKAIVYSRKKNPFNFTGQLASVIEKVVGRFYKKQKIHPATKTFQALRIEVNKELENIEYVLPKAVELLEEGGRLVVISFHSLEDRIVKNFFRSQNKIQKIITKKPIIPTIKEIKINPKARSAKMRVLEKINI